MSQSMRYLFAVLWGGVVSLLVGCHVPSQGGAYPREITDWCEETKAAQQQAAVKLAGDLQRAIETKASVFRIHPGDYRFTKGSEVEKILIRHIDGMHIQAEGVTFWFGLDSSLRLEGCRDVKVTGLTIDYDPLPFTQGTILAIDKDNATLDVRLDEGYRMPEHIGLPDTEIPGDGGYHIRYFDPSGEHMIKIPWEAAQSAQPLGEGMYRFYLDRNRLETMADHPQMVTPGYRMSLNQHGILPVDLYDCEDVTLEDVTMYSSPSIAVYERYGAGGNTYRRVRWIRRPGTNRMMVSTRDLFHSYGMIKGPLIEDCELSYCGDDMIAIHSFFSLVYEQQSPTRLVMVTPFESDISEGTSLQFLDLKTSEPLGEARVVRLEELREQKEETVNGIYEKLKAAGFRTRTFVEETTVLLVELDRPIKLKEFSCAQSHDRCGSGAVIRNNYIYEGTRMGIFPRCNNVLIENNRIERLGGSAIVHMPDTYWLEGVFTDHSRIVNNTIIDCCWSTFAPGFAEPHPGAIYVGAVFNSNYYPPMYHPYRHHRNITIENNTIIGSAAQGIFMANTKHAVVRNNTIKNPFSKPYGLEELNLAQTSASTIPEEWKNNSDLQEPFFGIFLLSVEDVVLENNKVKGGPDNLKGDIGIGPWAQDISIEE